MICAILQKYLKFLKIVRFLGQFDTFENLGITLEGPPGYLIEFCCCKQTVPYYPFYKPVIMWTSLILEPSLG